MTKIKICGIVCHRGIEAVNLFLPDYIGFVFAKESRRMVTLETAKTLKGRLDGRIKAVGVFVDEEIGSIVEAANQDIIDLIQLHGRETEDYIKKLKKKTKVPLIKAVQASSPEEVTRALSTSADMLLFDSQRPGSGKTFDHSLIPQGIRKPFFMAGGLNTDNVETVMGICRPFGLDVSSGVETSGQKDEEKIREFIETVRKTDHDNERMARI